MAFSIDKDCSVSGCARSSFCKTYCKAHYQRWYHDGDVRADVPVRANSLTGRHLSDTTKANISAARKGKKRSMPAWNKGLPFMVGEKHWNWKGGKGSERHAIMQRHEYKAWRLAVFTRDDYTCVMCSQHGGTLHADHIKAWAYYPELRLELDNGRTLCMACHYFITYKRKLPAGTVWAKTRGVFA